MAQTSGTKLTGWQKALLWLIAAIILWQVITTDAVGNALLGFFLGGEVPGTDTVLPPDVILWGTVGVAAGIAIIVAIRGWIGHRRVRRWRNLPQEPASERDTPALVGATVVRAVEIEKPKQKTKPAPKPKQAKTKAPKETPKQPRQPVWGPRFMRAARGLDEWLGIWVPRAERRVKVIVRSIGEAIKKAYRAVRQWVAQLSKRTTAAVQPAVKQSGAKIQQTVKKTAHTSQPHLQDARGRIKQLNHRIAVTFWKAFYEIRQLIQKGITSLKQKDRS